MTGLRTLPIRVHPLPGEALDSWLDALAHRLHTPLALALPALGLDSRGNRGMNPSWHVSLRPEEAESLAAVCGITPRQAHAMTLSAYHGRAVLIDSAARQVEVRRA